MKILFECYINYDDLTVLNINRSNDSYMEIREKADSSDGEFTIGDNQEVYEAAVKVFEAHGLAFTGDLENHTEGGCYLEPAACGPFTSVGTKWGSIGGMQVDRNGGYVIFNGLILPQNEWYDEDTEGEFQIDPAAAAALAPDIMVW